MLGGHGDHSMKLFGDRKHCDDRQWPLTGCYFKRCCIEDFFCITSTLLCPLFCVCFLNPWHVKFYEYILFCVSIRSSVCASVTKFFLNLFFSSFVKFCIVTETKKQKSNRSRFSRKILVYPKIGKKGSKCSFFTFTAILSLLFAGSSLKWKTLQNSGKKIWFRS